MTIKPRESHWHEVAEQYTLEPEPFSIALAEEIAGILKGAGLGPPRGLLEAGCGSGHLSLQLRQAGYTTDLLDFEPLAVEKARATFAQALGEAASQSQFIPGDLNHLERDLGDRRYDVVWNSGVLEHFSDEPLERVLGQMRAVAREAVFFIVPNPHSLVYLAYRQKMLEENRWSFGVEFLREDYEKRAVAAGLKMTAAGYLGRKFTENFLEYTMGGADAARYFQTQLASGQLDRELTLQYFLLTPQETRHGAGKTHKPVPQTPADQPSAAIDKTFYLDALGVANGMAIHLRHELDVALREREQLAARLETRERELAYQENLARDLERGATQWQAQLTERENLTHNLNARLAEKDQLIQSLSDRLAEGESLVHSLNARLAEKDQFIQSLVDRLSAGESETRQLGERLAYSEEQVARLNEWSGTLEILVQEKEHLLHQHLAQLAERADVIQSLNARLADKDQFIQGLTDRLNAGDGENAQLRAQRDQFEADAARLRDWANTLEGQTGEKEHLLRQYAAQLGERENLIMSLNARVADKDLTIQNLTDRLAQSEGQAGQLQEWSHALETQVQDKEHLVRQITAQMSERESLVMTLNSRIADKDQFLHNLNDQLNERNTLVEHLKGRISGREKQIAALTARQAELEAEDQKAQVMLQDKTAEAEALTEQLKDREEQIQKRDQQLEERERERQELATQVEANLTGLNERMNLLQGQLDERREATELLTHQLEEARRQAESLRAQQEFLANDKAQLERTVERLQLARQNFQTNLEQAQVAARQIQSTLADFCRQKRFLVPHYIGLFKQHLLSGPLTSRGQFVRRVAGKALGLQKGLIAEENPLARPIRQSEQLLDVLELLANGDASQSTVTVNRTDAPGTSAPGTAAPVALTAADPAEIPVPAPQPTRVPPRLPRRPHGKRRVAYMTNQLLDWNDLRPRYGGGERYAVSLASLLRDLGLEVTFFQPANRACEATYEGFPVVCFPLSEHFSEFHYGFCSKFTELSADYDHVVQHMPEYTSGLVRKDAIMVCHGIWFDHNNYPGAKFRTTEWYRHLGRSFSNPRLVVSVDTNSINYFRAIWPELVTRMRYIPNFYDARDFRPDLAKRDPEKLTILFPRRSQINRGSRILESILNRVPYDVRFLWVGEGDKEDTEMIRDLCKRDQRLSFHAAIFDEMPAWYQRADITVIPTIACEGTSLSCIEALACGSATISTNVGGLSDLVQTGNNGILVDPRPEALADAINLLIENPEERARLQRDGLASVAAFELSNWRRKWVGILREQGWVTEQAIAKAGYAPAKPDSSAAIPLHRQVQTDAKPLRYGIVTRNALHGGVESIIALESKGLDAPVIVAGGVDSPETCPFEYTRADSYDQLLRSLNDFDVVLYHWLPDWAVEAIADSGRPSAEFVHRTDTCDNDKAAPTRLIAHSDFLAEYISETFDRPCTVIEHPIDTEKFAPPERPGKFIGAVTSYYDIKGLDIFLLAWQEIQHEFKDLSVRFYGAGADQQKFEELARKLHIKAEFLPPTKEPWKANRDFSCFVLPSRQEGLPMTVLEALAMNVPVVSSDLDGIVEYNTIATGRGYEAPIKTFPTENPKAMAKVLREVLKAKKKITTRKYIVTFHGVKIHTAKLRECLSGAYAEGRGKRAFILRHLAMWNDEEHLFDPSTGRGLYHIGVSDEGVDLITPESAATLRETVYSADLFPCLHVDLPAGTTCLEWQGVADRRALVGWQIDWLDPSGKVLRYSADTVNMLPDKACGALTKQVPDGAVQARINLRPRPGETLRFIKLRVRAAAHEAH